MANGIADRGILAELKTYTEHSEKALPPRLFQSVVFRAFLESFSRLEKLEKRAKWSWFVEKVLPPILSSGATAAIIAYLLETTR